MPSNKLIVNLYCSVIEVVQYYNVFLKMCFGRQTVTFISWSACLQSMTANECDWETQCIAGRGVNDITTQVRHQLSVISNPCYSQQSPIRTHSSCFGKERLDVHQWCLTAQTVDTLYNYTKEIYKVVYMAGNYRVILRMHLFSVCSTEFILTFTFAHTYGRQSKEGFYGVRVKQYDLDEFT